MDIENYLSKLNEETNDNFRSSLEYRERFGEAHHYSCCIYEFAHVIPEKPEKDLLKTVTSQMETATFCAALGMYRQAFISLRLALEMGLGAVHFSVHRLELNEWLDGRADINWSSLICPNNGIMSQRFSRAFFNEFSEDIDAYRTQAQTLYRHLSEYVHGNVETWKGSEIEISYNSSTLENYFNNLQSVSEILLFVLSCRYLKTFGHETLETLQFIPEEMNHLDYVREYLGGPEK